MKAYVGCILALVGLVSAVSAENTIETCLKTMNDLTSNFEYPKEVLKLQAKIEAVVDLNRLQEISIRSNFDGFTQRMTYTIRVPSVSQCEVLEDMKREIRAETSCLGSLKWMIKRPIDEVLSGPFGKFARAHLACVLAVDVKNPLV